MSDESATAAVATPTPAATVPADDWASQTAGRLEELVDAIRTATTDRLLKVARMIVFGLLAAVVGIMALILLLIATVRALDELIPHEVWLTYLILGAIITVAGLFAWSKKERRPVPG